MSNYRLTAIEAAKQMYKKIANSEKIVVVNLGQSCRNPRKVN